MQITIDIPDNLPDAFLQKELKAFKERLNKIMEREELIIDSNECLKALEKIKAGDKSELTELGNIDEYIEKLKYEITQN
jgi:superfamily I DNA and/or RNA helicase